MSFSMEINMGLFTITYNNQRYVQYYRHWRVYGAGRGYWTTNSLAGLKLPELLLLVYPQLGEPLS